MRSPVSVLSVLGISSKADGNTRSLSSEHFGLSWLLKFLLISKRINKNNIAHSCIGIGGRAGELAGLHHFPEGRSRAHASHASANGALKSVHDGHSHAQSNELRTEISSALSAFELQLVQPLQCEQSTITPGLVKCAPSTESSST